jgi:hypothetical protein
VYKQLQFLTAGKDKDPNKHMNMGRMLVPRLPPVIQTYENYSKTKPDISPWFLFLQIQYLNIKMYRECRAHIWKSKACYVRL